MTVYVVQESPGKNISGAEQFGKIEILLPMGQVTFSPGPTVRRLRSSLHGYSDDDFILPIGDPAAIAIATAVAAAFNRGRFNILKWDRQEHLYIPVKVDIHGKY